MPYRYHYDPHQPRVPAGHSDGGQWTDGGFGTDPRIQRTLLGRGLLPARGPPATPLQQEAFRRVPWRTSPRLPTPAPAPPATPSPNPDPSASPPPPSERPLLDDAFGLFTWLSRHNDNDRQAIISFRAREYLFGKGEPGKFYLEGVNVLNREEVKEVCKKLKLVQQTMDDASKEVRTDKPNLAPSVHGTKVHTKLAEMIER
jgi:hypothetical protein